MKANRFGPGAGLAALAAVALATPAGAQTAQPSAASLAAAKEILTLKGATAIFAPAVPAVIESAKASLVQNNLNYSKDLNEIAAKLKTDYASRAGEIEDFAYRNYAARFTEAEIKEALAFFKSPVGRKVTAEEPKILDESMGFADSWARKFSDEVLTKFRSEMRARGKEL